MMDKMQESAGEYGMKINVKKTKVMKISKRSGEEFTIFLEGSNREKKSLRHVAMVAKFLDDNKPKTSLKK